MRDVPRRARRKVRYLIDQRKLLRSDDRRRDAARRGGRPTRAIVCVPEAPYPHSTLRRIAAHLGLDLRTGTPRPDDALVLFWNDHASTVREPDPALVDLAEHRTVVNIGSRDISKTTISRAFEDVFGYGLLVDPERHVGPAVEKPERNATHAGRVVMCPTSRREGFCYQRVVANEAGDAVCDIRVAVIGDQVPLVYLKYRPLEDRFSNVNTRAELKAAEDLLGDEEATLLVAFARRLGIDFCEMDVLRDTEDRRLYVVDVNTSPWGPPNHLPTPDVERAIELLAEAFERQFLIRAGREVGRGMA